MILLAHMTSQKCTGVYFWRIIIFGTVYNGCQKIKIASDCSVHEGFPQMKDCMKEKSVVNKRTKERIYPFKPDIRYRVWIDVTWNVFSSWIYGLRAALGVFMNKTDGQTSIVLLIRKIRLSSNERGNGVDMTKK